MEITALITYACDAIDSKTIILHRSGSENHLSRRKNALGIEHHLPFHEPTPFGTVVIFPLPLGFVVGQVLLETNVSTSAKSYYVSVLLLHLLPTSIWGGPQQAN